MGLGNVPPGKGRKLKQPFINWFEIPVLDLARAVRFYNYSLQTSLETIELSDYSMAIFPAQLGVGGALVMGQGCEPSEIGSLIYLNAPDDIQSTLERIEEAGGRVITEKTKTNDDTGYFALFIDSEGNRLALNSKN
ncbi:MAG: VOC family protein [Owenweeksia sp.]|nr:VOC family protein [Owenweeksia sp.]